jgi:hypothetical protein
VLLLCWCCCYAAAALLLLLCCCCAAAALLLLCCCYAAAVLLLCCCAAAVLRGRQLVEMHDVSCPHDDVGADPLFSHAAFRARLGRFACDELSDTLANGDASDHFKNTGQLDLLSTPANRTKWASLIAPAAAEGEPQARPYVGETFLWVLGVLTGRNVGVWGNTAAFGQPPELTLIEFNHASAEPDTARLEAVFVGNNHWVPCFPLTLGRGRDAEAAVVGERAPASPFKALHAHANNERFMRSAAAKSARPAAVRKLAQISRGGDSDTELEQPVMDRSDGPSADPAPPLSPGRRAPKRCMNQLHHGSEESRLTCKGRGGARHYPQCPKASPAHPLPTPMPTRRARKKRKKGSGAAAGVSKKLQS